MNKDQKLIWENYKQVNEGYTLNELVDVITGAVNQYGDDMIAFKYNINAIHDMVVDDSWDAEERKSLWNRAVGVYLDYDGSQGSQDIKLALQKTLSGGDKSDASPKYPDNYI